MAFYADVICAVVVFHFRVGTFQSGADMIANLRSGFQFLFLPSPFIGINDRNMTKHLFRFAGSLFWR